MGLVLPPFRYHPDPIATESVKASKARCVCCGEARGAIYVGPVYAEEELDAALCPWCIADGAAAAKFDATFTDRLGIGDYGRWERVPDQVLDEVSQRTPGFRGWQQERWFTCCGDAAVFVGRAGREQLALAGLGALAEIQREAALEGEEWEQYLCLLDRDGSPTAYLFRCEKCGRCGGYSDCQ